MGGCSSSRGEQNPILRDYDIKEKLGSGTFATVRRVVHKKSGEIRALKIVNLKGLKEEEITALLNEVSILNNISHKHIVRQYQDYQDDTRIYLLQELLSGGELFDRIVDKQYFTEKLAARCIQQCASALVYLHERDIVHRDLKPENLLLTTPGDDADLKVIDFGLAKQSSEKMSMPCGTPGYVAPEILEKRPYHKEVDMWSLGVILYILLCGFPPFNDQGGDLKKLYRAIKGCRYNFPAKFWGNVSDDAKNLVRSLLTKDPQKRLTAEQVLQNSWIKGNAPEVELGKNYTKTLKRTQLVNRLRRGVQVVVALTKLVSYLDDSKY